MADPRFEITAVDKFSRVLREAKNGLNGLKSSLGGMSSVTSALTGNFAALAGSLSVGGLVVGFKTLVDGIDDLADRAQGLGVTASALSDLQVAARTAGVGGEELGAALTKLNVRMTDAAAGGKESAAVFKALGINVRNSAGDLRSTEDVLGEVADRFASYRDGAEKSALAVELFGRSGAKLIAYLNGGAAALKTYSGLSEETVRESAKMAAEFDKLAANAERAKNAIAGALVPAINALFDSFRGGSTEEKIAEIETILRSLNQTSNAQSAKNVAMYTAELERLKKVLSDERIQNFLAGASAARRADNPAPRAPGVGGGASVVPKAEQISASRTALAQYVDQLERAQEALEGISDEERTLRFLRANPGIDTAQVRELLATEQKILDLRKRAAAARREDEEGERRVMESIRSLDGQLDQFSGRAEDALKIALTARLEARLAAGEIFSPEQLEATVKGIGGIRDEIAKTKDVGQELGLIFESAFEDAILGANSFSAVLKALGQDLARVFLRQTGTKPLFDWFGSILPSFGGARAAGGPVLPGQTYLVGERGPELLTMGAGSGRVVANGKFGTPSFNVVVNVDSRTDQAVIAASVRRGMRAAQAEIYENMRRGGAFA